MAPESDDQERGPYPTMIEFQSQEFGQPWYLKINGHPVNAVQGIKVEQTDGEFSKVVITLGGCVTKVNPRPEEWTGG